MCSFISSTLGFRVYDIEFGNKVPTATISSKEPCILLRHNGLRQQPASTCINKFFYIPSLGTVVFGLLLYVFEKTIFPVKLFAAAAVLLLVLAMMHGDFELTTVDGSADSDSIHEDGPTDVCYQQSSCSNY